VKVIRIKKKKKGWERKRREDLGCATSELSKEIEAGKGDGRGKGSGSMREVTKKKKRKGAIRLSLHAENFQRCIMTF